MLTQASPLYPPRVKAPRNPPPFPGNFIRLIMDNLSIVPEQAYREPVVIARGPPRLAFISGTELVKKVLCDQPAEFPKGRVQINVQRALSGDAFLSSEGAQWRWQRQAATKPFRHGNLSRYGPIMTAAAEAAVANWRATPPNTLHPIHTHMIRATAEVITHASMSADAEHLFATFERENDDFYRGINWWIAYTALRFPHWLPRPGGRVIRRYERQLRKIVGELVQAQQGSDAYGILGYLRAACDPETGHSMSPELLRDNILAFILAGADTTAFLLTWALYLISQSPEWEFRMLQEIEDAAGGDPIESGHVEHLALVRQFLNETLRLFPAVPILMRDIHSDLESDAGVIPGGTMGIIPIYAIHRHRSYWHDPDRFDPERFHPENAKKLARFQFMPFGEGPRTCIGAAFATLEATIMLATFIRAARFAVDPGFDPKPVGRLHLVPKNGMPMRVTLR